MKRGFTLLLAVLVSSILLSLGFALYNIAQKEIILSTAGRDSQFAFYAADSGVECSYYYDKSSQDIFATSSTASSIACGGAGAPVAITRADTQGSTDHGTDVVTRVTTFTFTFGSSVTSPCAVVSVTRNTNPTQTSILSEGYNTCVATNPRRLERAIRVQY